MANDINFTRGGKGYIATEGLTAENKSRVSIADADLHPEHQQPVRRAPIRITIELDEGNLNGEVVSIVTTWKTALISNAGGPLHGQSSVEQMTSSPQNRDEFVAMFAPALKFMLNGYVRAELGGNKTGFNELPLFDATGSVVTYAPEQEAEPANNHYYNPPQQTPEP